MSADTISSKESLVAQVQVISQSAGVAIAVMSLLQLENCAGRDRISGI
ncbi:MAG: hypothetical protein AAGG51_19525 [Cyanobacteria bacterium P01_G01_bin.54]